MWPDSAANEATTGHDSQDCHQNKKKKKISVPAEKPKKIKKKMNTKWWRSLTKGTSTEYRHRKKRHAESTACSGRRAEYQTSHRNFERFLTTNPIYNFHCTLHKHCTYCTLQGYDFTINESLGALIVLTEISQYASCGNAGYIIKYVVHYYFIQQTPKNLSLSLFFQ